jgi:VCBS repeat protein
LGVTTSISNGGQALSGIARLWAVDCNKEGKLDLLVLGSDTNLYELLGNGDGTFGPARIGSANVPSITVADLNHDSLPEIITYTPTAGANTGTGYGPIENCFRNKSSPPSYLLSSTALTEN